MIPVAKLSHISTLFAFLLALTASGTLLAGDAQAAGGATYGDKPTFQSSDNFVYSLSDDKQAFTINFNPAFEAQVANAPPGKDPGGPIATKVFSLVLPVTGKYVKTTFVVTASVIAEAGAGGAIMLIVNDKQTVTRYSTTGDKEVLVQLKYSAESPSDIRLTVILMADHDSAHPKAASLVHVTAIDSDLALMSKKRAAAKGKK
jgi:hypothetical protein